MVVDQGQNPQVARLLDTLRSAGIHTEYIPSSERGRAAGVNRGLDSVKTDLMAITDDDCFVEADWLEQMAKHLRGQPRVCRHGTGRAR